MKLYKDDIESFPPIMRGKKNDDNLSAFFPLPPGYYSKKLRRNTRSTQAIATADALSVPWTMRYFSPMLRG